MKTNQSEINNVSSIDYAKIIFACLIPILHIPYGEYFGIIQQYIARIGVPFFFAVSGMFLNKSIEKNGKWYALIKFEKRIFILFIFWFTIYSPIILKEYTKFKEGIFEILFVAPAYLWYLTAAAAAAVPVCLIQNKRLSLLLSLLLYAMGTALGGGYSWITGGWEGYEEIFLTTRNGIFFGFPLMAVGIESGYRKPCTGFEILISGILLFLEISFVGMTAFPNTDRSMYFMLPVFVYNLLRFLKKIDLNKNTAFIRKCSSAIYLMQFGIISVCSKALSFISIDKNLGCLYTWILVIIIPCIITKLLWKTKIVRIIF